MKKLAYILLAVAAFGVVSASAEMDNKPFTGTPLGTTAITNSYVLRGTLEGVAIDLTAPATNTVTITDEYGQTLFSKSSIAADAYYGIVFPQYTYAAAAATFVGGTNDTANVVYGKTAIAGKVTCVILGVNAAVSNACTVTLIYNR
jgi:hypothetical protein